LTLPLGWIAKWTSGSTRTGSVLCSAALAMATALAAVAVAGCAHETAKATAAAPVLEARWQDGFDDGADVVAVVRPSRLKRDKVYGPLLRRVIQLGRERSGVLSATPLEAIEDADELVVGLRSSKDPDDPNVDVALAIVGVRADIDPAGLVDATGHALWAPGPSGEVREFVRERDDRGLPLAASLFELPGRTWVIVSGEARQRAREAFAHPLGKPPIDLDPDALAVARVDGPSLVARVHALQDLGTHAAIGRKLRALILRLPPGSTGALEFVLLYADEDAAAFAEVTAREAVAAIGRKKPEGLTWLASAAVDRTDRRVVVKLPLPTALLEGLPKASPTASTPGSQR
jgi:hypothetical protein